MSEFPATNTQTEYFALGGGLDLTTPFISLPPGSAFEAINYEQGVTGGYRQVDGFERFDGRPSPSSANYWLLPITPMGVVPAGSTITGATSGATAVVLQVNAAEFVVTKLTGAFVAGEILLISGMPMAETTGAALSGSATTSSLDAAYKVLAADNYRTDIGTVPGSGRIRGVWLYKDTVYAFRDNAGATAGTMWQSTSGGWVQVQLGYEVSFTSGSAIINDGDTVTGGTSGATGVVKRSMLASGAWTGSGAGRLVLASVTGTFQAGEALKVGGTSKATCSGAQSAITLAPGGRYEFVNANFTGSADTLRMYGCNGVNRAFEFDGTTFCPISTGMATDTPSFIAVHRLHLFLAFRGSLQHSSPGYPYQWSVVVGAGEIGLGDTITGLLPQPSNQNTGTMLVATRHMTYMLYGTSVANWVLSLYAGDLGAAPYTLQNIGVNPVYLDNRGLVRLSTTNEYGNFEQTTFSRKIQPLIDYARGNVIASSIHRSKNQYRIYLGDGTAIVCTLLSKAGSQSSSYSFTQIDYGTDHPVRCIVSADKTDGTEAVFFGSDDGYVYQAEKGFTFDGTAITRFLALAFNHSKSPRLRKRYRKAVIEMAATGSATIQIAADFSYGSADIAVNPLLPSLTYSGNGGFWDVSSWDSFYWDGETVSVPEISITGTGTNISIRTYSNTKEPSHTLQGIILHYTPRRITR